MSVRLNGKITWTNEVRKLSDLKIWPDNPKTLTAETAEHLETSIEHFGLAIPLLISPGNDIYDGNQRSAVMEHMGDYGPDALIDVRVSNRSLTTKERRELVIRLRENQADWNLDMLADWDMGELGEWGFDADLLAGMAGNGQGGGEGQDAEPPEVTQTEAEKYQEKWQVQEGQTWQLGRHRIACVDCLDETAVKELLGEATPSFVWSDPPYGADIVAANGYVGGGEAYDIPFGGVKNRKGYVGGGARIKARTGLYPIQTWKKEKRLGSTYAAKPFGSKGSDIRGSVGAANMVDVGKYAPVIGDESTDTAVRSSSMYLSMFSDSFQVWWGANYYANDLPAYSCWIVWDKENTGNFSDCELAWTNHNGAVRIFRHMWNGMLKDSEQGQRRVHPTQKPVVLAKWAFEKYGRINDIILDPFLGSGISVLAAEQLNDGRSVYGCELSPAYIAVVIQRWANLTGGEPYLANYHTS